MRDSRARLVLGAIFGAALAILIPAQGSAGIGVAVWALPPGSGSPHGVVSAEGSSADSTGGGVGPAARNVPEIRALRVNPGAPRMDGWLDDPAWQNPELQVARHFTQCEPHPGEGPSESTRVAVAYDEDAIYFAFWCYDSEPERISRQLVRRDRSSESDLIAIRLDSHHDHQTGYGFELSAAGVQRDVRYYNDTWSDSGWDAVWESNVRLQPWGWSAEVRIPYQCLRFSEKDEHVWGADFLRFVHRKCEVVQWSYVPPEESGRVSKFGHITGLHDIRPHRLCEVMPYVVTRLETGPGSVGDPDGRRTLGNLGLDFKYGLATDLILNATINPDFGQVELDRPVLNLSTFETYFPEKRPFFQEGADLFDAMYALLYSRRIGRPPQNDVADPDLDYYTDYPDATTILGAAKITGRIAPRTSIAALTALTEEEEAEYVTTTGESRRGVVESAASYSTLRVKQDVFERSNVGAMLTLVNQETVHPAAVGSADWRLFTNDGMWSFCGQTIFSRVDGEKTGFATDAQLQREGGRHIRGAIGTGIKDPHLAINRLGYTSRNDVRNGWLWLQYRTVDEWWITRESWNNVNANVTWNYAGNNIGRSWNFNNSAVFTNNWTGGCGFAQNTPEYSDRETRGHGLWEHPASWNAWIWLDTDERRSFSVEVDYALGRSRRSPWWGAELLLRYRPAGNMEFSIHGDFTHDFGQLMWVENPDDSTTVFADKDQDIFSLEATAGVVFRRNLSLQVSAQGLLTGLDYEDYRAYLGGGRYGPALSGFDHDYQYSALNSTLLLRWEYEPGSTLYAVWTRALSEVDDSVRDLRLGRDWDRWFGGGGENLFLIKMSYRLVF